MQSHGRQCQAVWEYDQYTKLKPTVCFHNITPLPLSPSPTLNTSQPTPPILLAITPLAGQFVT